MQMLLRAIPGVAAIVILAACGSPNEGAPSEEAPIDSVAQLRTAAASIAVGMSQEEVRNRLGEPRTVVTMDAGFERWTYYNYDAQGRVAAKTLVIFGEGGKVVEVNDM